MTKPFDPFNQCTEYSYRIEKLLADNTALKAENESLRKDMLAAEQLNNKLLRDALEAVIKVHGYESGIPVEAISTQPTSTEALDAYVAEKVKEARRTAEYWKSNHLAGNEQIATLTRQRDLAVEALRASLDALRLPCDRWNKNQSMIISNALKIGEDALSTIKSEVKE